MKIKMLVLLVDAAGLSGCAVYPAPYETYDPDPAYVTAPPVYIYGSGTYRSSGPRYAPAHPGNYRPHPGHHGPREGMRSRRDRDRDGVPDRHDRRPGNPHVR